jgi:AraC family transcriptional regulator of adaptative response / DNA-3-methyladenine glycosylase II
MPTQRESIVCEVSYRPPLDWCGLLEFLAFRASSGVEAVEGSAYQRTVRANGKAGWIRVTCPCPSPAKVIRHVLQVELSNSLIPVLPQVLTRVKRLFDLSAEPCRIESALKDLVADPGVRVPGAFDGFEIAVRAILGQQVSVHAASVIAGKFSRAFGEPIETPFPTLNRLFPSPQLVTGLHPSDIAAVGIIASRARSIALLAQAVVDRRLVLRPGADPDLTRERLCAIPGIGPWTAEYVAMRALSWPDAFPASDLGIRKALGMPTERQALAQSEAWRPWRSYAAMHLWRTL